MYPCVRDAGLTGIGVGFGVGGIRALFGGMLCDSTYLLFHISYSEAVTNILVQVQGLAPIPKTTIANQHFFLHSFASKSMQLGSRIYNIWIGNFI